MYKKKRKEREQSKNNLIYPFTSEDFDQIDKTNNDTIQDNEHMDFDSFLDEIEELTDELLQNIENEQKDQKDE